jgi:tryptophan halogenase
MAHEAGWQWRIPLQHRVGNGIVYCSDYMTDEEARAKLLATVEGELLIEPRLIRYRTGSRRLAWNGNCVALGLASGFVEPLESTSIHLIMTGVTRLIQMFPFDGISPAVRDHYNGQARREIESIRDFIILHYHLNRRDEPFWQRCRTMEVPETLAQRIALFRENALAYQASDDLFRVDSWIQCMLGQRLEPEAYHPVARLMPPGRLRKALEDLKGNIAGAVARMPDHQQFLDLYCGEEEPQRAIA